MAAWFEAPDFANVAVQHEGKDVPIKDVQFFKDTPDIPTLAKRAYEAHSEVGRRIPIKIDASKPEAVENWRKEHLPKLYQAGVLAAPPARVEDYEIKKPDNLEPGLNWNDDLAKKFGETMLKHGVPKAAAAELLAIHSEAMGGFSKSMELSYEQGKEALKQEWGSRYDEVMENCKRFSGEIFKTPEEVAFFNETGIGNHPAFLSIMSRLADRAGADNSIIPGGRSGGTGMTMEQAQSEHAAIATDPNNPKYKLYHAGDPATMQYIDDLYKKVEGGDKKVTIGNSVS